MSDAPSRTSLRAAFWFIAVLLVALVIRLCIAELWPWNSLDGLTYLDVARNIYQNGCISLSDPATGKCVPHWGGNQLPGYPIFVAAALSLTGNSVNAVLVIQTLIFVISLGWLMYAVTRASSSIRIALFVGLLIAVSPTSIAWPRSIATETLALAITIWVFADLLLSLAQRSLRWLPLGLGLLAAISIRYDGVLLAIPIAICGFMIHRPKIALKRGLALALIPAIGLTIFSIRNIVVGLTIVPDSIVMRKGTQVPSGYVTWGSTWSTNLDEVHTWLVPALHLNYSLIYIPGYAFDSEQEKTKILGLLHDLSGFDNNEFPRNIDDQFLSIANDRRRQNPLRNWAWLPMLRAVSMWSDPNRNTWWPTVGQTGHSTDAAMLREKMQSGIVPALGAIISEPVLFLRKLIPIGYRIAVPFAAAILIIGGVLGYYNRLTRNIIFLAVSYLVVRTAVLSVIHFGVPRYAVEAIPPIEIAAVFVVAHFIVERRSKRKLEQSVEPTLRT